MPRRYSLDPKPWGDLVFHVLSHVRPRARAPSSVWDPAYVAFAREMLGAASTRHLEADAQVLEELLVEHARLASVQRLAWLFVALEKAQAVTDRDLASLRSEDVDAPELLESLVAAGPAVEVLRSAAELERTAFLSLPAMEFDRDRLALELEQATEVAPELERMDVAVVRSLRLRGRAAATEVWIGAPVEIGEPSYSHVVWQASHEASVSELVRLKGELGERLEERELESAALVLLHDRAQAKGRAKEHLHWFRQFRTPLPARASLSAVAQALLAAAGRRSAT